MFKLIDRWSRSNVIRQSIPIIYNPLGKGILAKRDLSVNQNLAKNNLWSISSMPLEILCVLSKTLRRCLSSNVVRYKCCNLLIW